jgi:hypothetical protein
MLHPCTEYICVSIRGGSEPSRLHIALSSVCLTAAEHLVGLSAAAVLGSGAARHAPSYVAARNPRQWDVEAINPLARIADSSTLETTCSFEQECGSSLPAQRTTTKLNNVDVGSALRVI